MAETPRLDLPYLSASQAQKEVMHNISLDRLDLLVQCAVLDRNLTTPPGSPALGDAYIVAAGATGAWAGHNNHLALWISSQWEFIAPLPGFTCWVTDETVLVYWSGSAWVIASGGGGSTTFLGLSDTPDSYTGQAGKAVLVNAGGTALEFGTSGGGAPVDASYIVSGANATLTAERVLTNSASLTWNTATAGQVSADIPVGGVTLAHLAPLAFPALLGRGNPPTGDVEAVTIGAGLQLTGGTLSLTTAPGASDFLSLTDTPDSYSGQGGKAVLVNAGATALEFGTVASGVVTEAEISLSDVTADNATTTLHGFLPKLSGVATEYLNGVGAWSTPAGGGAGGTTLGARVARVATQTLASGTTDTMSFDTETLDQATYWSAAQPTRLTIATTGWYSLTAYVLWSTSTPHNGQANLNVRTNGSTALLFDREYSYGTIEAHQSVSGIFYLTAADYLEVVLTNNLTAGTASLTGYLTLASVSTPGTVPPTWLSLTDTPDSYSGQGGKVVQVNAGATATEFGPVLGTMAEQHANAVAITGGTATFTGNVAATNRTGNSQYGFTTNLNAAGGADRYAFLGTGDAPSVLNGRLSANLGLTVQQTAGSDQTAIYSSMGAASGTGRYFISHQGDAQSYFGGLVICAAALRAGTTSDTTNGNIRYTGTDFEGRLGGAWVSLTAGSGGQPADATLTALAGLATGADQLPYFTGTDTASQTPLTAAGRALLDDADAAEQRTTLGLGTLATQNANAVAITGGSATGLSSVTTTGNVGIANATPSYPLDVTGDAAFRDKIGVGRTPFVAKIEVEWTPSAGNGINMKTTSDTNAYALVFNNAAGSVVGSISTTASNTAYNTTSDARLKHAITPLTGALDVIRALNPITHLWKSDGSRGYSFLAHEVQETIPDGGVVTGEPDAVDDEGRIVPQMYDPSKLVPWLTAALQEAMAQVEALTARVAQLEGAV